jgi:hypothetical protein
MGRNKLPTLPYGRHQVLVDGMKRPLIPYAGYDPHDHVAGADTFAAKSEFTKVVADSFSKGLDTETIARLMCVRECAVANALARHRDA